MVAGIKTMPVHYRGGGDTVKDLLSGQVKMMFSSIAPVQQFVKDGRLIGLATTGPKRDPAFPDLPTIAESGYPGFDVRLWIGLTAPAGTPKDIIHKLADANKQGAGIARGPEGAGRSGLRADDRVGGGVRRLLPRRARQVGQGHQGNRAWTRNSGAARRMACAPAGNRRLRLVGTEYLMSIRRLGPAERLTAEETTMAWTTPTLVEICIGLEINGYLPAEF